MKNEIKAGDKVEVIRYGFKTKVKKIEKSHFINDKDVYILDNGCTCHIEEIKKVTHKYKTVIDLSKDMILQVDKLMKEKDKYDKSKS